MSTCSNSWGNWRGGGPLSGAGGGFRQLSDMFNEAVLEADPGTYVDVYISSAEFSTFICTVQHQVFGIIHHAKVISNFYLSRLGAYDSSVIDLTDSAELGLVSGSLSTWDGGVSTTGDVELSLHFYGLNYIIFRNASAECLLWDAVETPAENSMVMMGYQDPAITTDQIMGGMAYSFGGGFWGCAIKIKTAVFKGIGTANFVYLPTGDMPITKTDSRITLWHEHMGEEIGYADPIGRAKSHSFPARSRPFGGASTFDTVNSTTMVYKIDTGGTSTINSVLEVVSEAPMQVPSSGY